MLTTLCIPSEAHETEAMNVWNRLGSLDPLPFAGAQEQVIVEVRDAGSGRDGIASATLKKARRLLPASADISLSEQFFASSPAVQLGVLLHEAVHINLYDGRLRRNYDAILDADREERLREYSGRPEDAHFGSVRWNVALSVLHLAQEIGADLLMLLNYPTVSCEFWEQRCNNYCIARNRPIRDAEAPRSLAPFATFYRAVVADHGLRIPVTEELQQTLKAHHSECAERFEALCMSQPYAWLEDERATLLRLDPTGEGSDPLDYANVSKVIRKLQA